VLVNGVHGGLRDLPNDLAHGSHTTAIQFGARPAGSGVLVPASLRRYCWSLQIGMGAVAAVPALPGRSGWYAAGLACTVVALALCGRALRATDDKVRFKHLGATHILACYLPAMSMAAATGGWPFGLATASVMAGPMLGNPSFIAAFRTLPALVFEPPAWRRSRSDHAPAGERP
jgi:hypothetical protein